MSGLRWVLAVGGVTAVMAMTSGLPVTAHITYVETNHGKTVGATATGVVGHGTISLAGALGGLLAKLPTRATYVTRYDIEASGNYRALLLAQAKAGSICLSGDVAFGRFKQGASFPPTSGTYSTVGGTGLGATLRLSGSYRITAVSGT
ncbi:MAG TPA: hypothetical protein VKR23_03075, partial [Gaiellaceae bacterium]|nr:hypothetical protein [Gaiellaceae bacterium]